MPLLEREQALASLHEYAASAGCGNGRVRRLTALSSAALMITAFMIVAPAARAGTEHAPPWRWTTVSIPRTSVAVGAQHDVTLNCPSGYRPVSWIWGSSFDNASTTLTLQAETMDYNTNSGLLRVYNNTSHDDAVDATLNCVYGADIGTVTTLTTVVSHTIGNTGGFRQCGIGTAILGGSASWDIVGPNSRIDFVAPTSSGWYVTGNTTAWTGTLTISVHCISSGVATGLHIAQTSSTADPNAEGLVTATASCSAGERVANAGAYEHTDSGSIDATKTLGAIRSISQYSSAPLASSAWVKASEPNTTTTLVVFAICVLYATPSVSITSGPNGLQSSPDIAFTFTATDSAGYQLTLSCTILKPDGPFSYVVYRQSPCDPAASNAVTGIEDGTYQLAVSATNGDYQTSTTGRGFSVDATPPVLAVDGKPANPTTATDASFTVGATDPHPGTTYCHLDSAPEQPCSSPAAYSGLADGLHAFHWRAVDSLGNQASGSYSWRVDTVAPTAALTAPAAPFTTSTATTVKWTGSDSGSGIASWQVQWRRAAYNGGFGAWSSPARFGAGTSSHRYSGLAAGYDYCYRVRSLDAAGNASAYSPRRCTSVVLDERALTASGGWVINTSSAYYGGSALSSKHLNATLKRSGAQLDRLALLASTCATCGVVGAYVAGALIAKVNLHASSTHNRRLIRLAPFRYRTGTVTLKVLTGGKLVRIDGLGISRT